MATRRLRAGANGGLAAAEVLGGGTLFYDMTVDGANLPTITELDPTEHVIVAQSGTPKKITAANLLSTGAAAGKAACAFENSDLVAGVLTFEHNTGYQYGTLQIMNGSDKIVLPDDVDMTSTTTVLIDLNSFGTISGTWHAVFVGAAVT